MMLSPDNLPRIPDQFALAIDAQTLGELAARVENVRDLANTNDVLGPFELQNALSELSDVVLTLLRADRCQMWPPHKNIAFTAAERTGSPSQAQTVIEQAKNPNPQTERGTEND